MDKNRSIRSVAGWCFGVGSPERVGGASLWRCLLRGGVTSARLRACVAELGTPYGGCSSASSWRWRTRRRERRSAGSRLRRRSPRGPQARPRRERARRRWRKRPPVRRLGASRPGFPAIASGAKLLPSLFQRLSFRRRPPLLRALRGAFIFGIARSSVEPRNGLETAAFWLAHKEGVMPRSALRRRVLRRHRPPFHRRVLVFCWRILRVILTVGAALGPGMPPPPPPPRPTADLVASGGKEHDEE